MILGSLVLLDSPASARTPKCLGQKATIVAKPGSGITYGTKGSDVIVGTSGPDAIVGFGAKTGFKDKGDLICGGGDDDVIAGGRGNDQMSGGAGDDQLFYGFASRGVTASLVTGRATGEGTDSFTSFQTISGSEFGDTLTGDYAVNFFFGNGGNDQILGGPPQSGDSIDQTDIIAGGDGDDVIDGGDGFDMVSYQDRPDNENGTSFGVTVDLPSHSASGFGTDALDRIEAVWGSPQDDVIMGDGQDNFLVPAQGDDEVTGGGGDDYAIFWFAGQSTPSFTGVTANLANGTATGEGNDTLGDGIEGLFGSIAGNDHLTGDDGPNLISGDAGDDVLNGGLGDDYISGGFGNDVMDGGGGTYDLIDFSLAPGPVTASLASGTATGDGTDTFTNAEALFGSSYNDTLTGDANANFLFAWFGDDTANGGEGDDQIDAGPGADVADGGAGTNLCAEAEQFTSCTSVPASQIQQHPLNTQAQEIANFRRNF